MRENTRRFSVVFDEDTFTLIESIRKREGLRSQREAVEWAIETAYALNQPPTDWKDLTLTKQLEKLKDDGVLTEAPDNLVIAAADTVVGLGKLFKAPAPTGIYVKPSLAKSKPKKRHKLAKVQQPAASNSKLGQLIGNDSNSERTIAGDSEFNEPVVVYDEEMPIEYD